jgi:hypothetical protein
MQDADSAASCRGWVAAIASAVQKHRAAYTASLQPGQEESLHSIISGASNDAKNVAGGKFWKKNNAEERVFVEATIRAQVETKPELQRRKSVTMTDGMFDTILFFIYIWFFVVDVGWRD